MIANSDPYAVVCYHAAFDAYFNRVQLFYDWLSKQEKKRADQFFFVKDKYRFIISRGLLRQLLAKHLNLYPPQIKFKTNTFGKPSLQNDELFFNVSHSNNKIVIALSHNQIGIDIEFINPSLNYRDLINAMTTAEENSTITTLEQFYQLWTCKEAFLKGIGYGLSFGMRALSVQFNAYDTISFQTHKEEINTQCWQGISLSLDNYYLSCAIKQAYFSINQFHFLPIE